jgi:hypothetical protein
MRRLLCLIGLHDWRNRIRDVPVGRLTRRMTYARCVRCAKVRAGALTTAAAYPRVRRRS